MLYSMNKKQFIKSALANNYYFLTDIMRDINNFGGKFYLDETGIFYLSIAYDSTGETIMIFACYSEQILSRANDYFPNAFGFCFICDYIDYNDDNIVR